MAKYNSAENGCRPDGVHAVLWLHVAAGFHKFLTEKELKADSRTP